MGGREGEEELGRSKESGRNNSRRKKQNRMRVHVYMYKSTCTVYMHAYV